MIQKKEIIITPFNLKRKVHIYLPKGYNQSDKKYPVLYMFDGHNLFYDKDATYGTSWGLKDYFDKHHIEWIIVGVECNHEGNERLCEYSPYSFKDNYFGSVTGKGKEYMDWLVKECKPWAEKHYRIKKGRNNTFIGGSSMGGLMSIYAIGKYNKYFSKAICISSFLWKNFDQLLKDIDVEMKNTQIYLSWGAKESSRKSFLAKATHDNLEVGNLFLKNGAQVFFNQPLEGKHNEESWNKEIPVFMNYFLKK